MHKSLKNLAFALTLTMLSVFSLSAQDTKIIANADGSYTVIEYPLQKDVEVRLLPMKGISSTGMAHVLRTNDGTKVVFDITGAPADWKEVYAYSVDPAGASTFLGPITFADGVGKAEFMTPGNQFMLVVSPKEGLTAYDATTSYVFRSEVPAGYAIVPRGKVVVPMAANVASSVVTRDVAAEAYNVPMLGVAKFKGKTTDLRLKFDSGELKGLEAKAFLKPVDGKTQITMKFSDLQKVPMNKRFVLWTSSSQGYTKVGQIIHAGPKDTAQIRGETALNDFGLLLTVEDADVERPTSTIYSTFTVIAP